MSTPEAQTCPTCGSDCNERDELIKAEREINRLTAELDESRAERSVAYLAFEQVTADRDALVRQNLALCDAMGYSDRDQEMDSPEEHAARMRADARAALAAAPAPAPAADWSVFNSGAHVASGLSYAEALDYLTPERLARGWSAVCVVDKDAHGIGTDARAQAQKGE